MSIATEFQCAVAARRRSEALFATASQVRRWLLIEVRGAWGRDAVANTDLARYASPAWRRWLDDERIRIVAIRRDLDLGEDQPVRMFFADSEGGSCWRRDVAGLHAAMDASTSIPDGEGSAPGGWSPHTEPVLLVCTNGRHDSCCATFGRPLVRHLRRSSHAGSAWESSHVGGDRFAANLVILPDGLYFGRCDPDAAERLLAAYHRGHLDLDTYRGRSTRGFVHQAAEYFVRRELGLTALDAVGAIRRIGEQDGVHCTFAVDLTDDDGQRSLTVTVARTRVRAPDPLTCTGPAGLEVPRYELVTMSQD